MDSPSFFSQNIDYGGLKIFAKNMKLKSLYKKRKY